MNIENEVKELVVKYLIENGIEASDFFYNKKEVRKSIEDCLSKNNLDVVNVAIHNDYCGCGEAGAYIDIYQMDEIIINNWDVN